MKPDFYNVFRTFVHEKFEHYEKLQKFNLAADNDWHAAIYGL